MAELGALALAEATRRLTEQQQALASIRSAGGTVLAAVSIASAFLGSVALDGQQSLSPMMWAALIVTGATAIIALLPLRSAELGVVVDLETLDDPAWTQQSDNDAALHLARYLAERADKNVDILDGRWRVVQFAAGGTALSITLWIIAITTRTTP